MTNEATRTMTFVAAAVVLTALALWAGPSRDVPPIFDDKGQEFFPGFTDPTKPVALEIMEFDSDTAELRPFKVQFKNGRWSIPSHYDYPADAKDRMAEAAGLFVGLTKDDIRSDDPADHALYGVGDPMEQSLDLEGRGTKVTFKDSNGNDMASLILGKAVEGREGFRYVRYPDKKRTYSAKLPAEVSTKFGDWIEKDLLQLSSADLHRMSFDAYSVDEVTFNITPGEKLVADKKDLDWVVEGLSDSEETNKDALRTAASTLDQLEIVGVRTKPPGLTGQLTRAEGIQMSQENVFSLQSKGFFLTRDGTLKANEGDLLLDTKGGIGYKLSFGEVLYGEGDAVTAGGGDETASGGDAGADGAARTGVANRYLMVTARFDESLLDRPEKGEPLPDEHLEKRKAARTERS
jgi:hypothetical protein